MKKMSKVMIVIVLVVAVLCILILWGNGSEKEPSIMTDEGQEGVPESIEKIPEGNSKAMEDLGFGSFNENRLLKIKLRVGDEYVYESDYIKPSLLLDENYFENITDGMNVEKCVAEIYSYTVEGELVGMQEMELEILR